MAPEGQVVFVTWRLAGAIRVPPPASLKSDPNPGKAFAGFDRALDRTQFGARWLGDTRVANMVVEAIHYGADVRHSYDLGAWVVMPNHVHLVIQPHEPLPAIVRWLKTATACRANKLTGMEGPFWQREYYDHWIRSRDELDRITAYIERNPVSAGWVRRPEAWLWSSANRAGDRIASGTTGNEPMTTVVAGILRRDGRVLICRRRADQPHSLKWEFPGGKIEAGESPQTALIRELREELGIESIAGTELMRYEFAYPEKKPILLIFLEVTNWQGEIENRIFEEVVWEKSNALATYDFLEGDAEFLVKTFSLPRQ